MTLFDVSELEPDLRAGAEPEATTGTTDPPDAEPDETVEALDQGPKVEVRVSSERAPSHRRTPVVGPVGDEPDRSLGVVLLLLG